MLVWNVFLLGVAEAPDLVALDHLALQVALLIPMLVSGLGLLNSFRMLRLPDIESSDGLEGAIPG